MAIVHVLRSSIFVYAILLRLPTIITLSDSEALLKLKESFTNATILDSWKAGTEPCAKGKTWTGVVCGITGSPSRLQLGSLRLSGKIDVDALASLSSLKTINFASNHFSGPIPRFNRLPTLNGLFLSKNQFSGEIPSDYFNTMRGLKKLWLSDNNFSGQVPSSLGNLSRLTELHLEGNHFSGKIPAQLQPRLVFMNLSDNKLEGEIPSWMLRFGPKCFRGNSGLCGRSLGNSCKIVKHEKHRARRKLFVWFLLASGVVFIAMLIGVIVMKRRQDTMTTCLSGSSKCVVSSIERGTGSRRKGSKRGGASKSDGEIVMMNEEGGAFNMTDLMKATAEVLGNGTLGCTYKATMASGNVVVVKRIKEMKRMGRDQFDGEMRRIARLNHKNVLAPMAYQYGRQEKLVVYKHQPKGSLFFVLHGSDDCDPKMTWALRVKIMQGIARGLGYLHSQLSTLEHPPHANLKSTNVLLTSDYEPLLTDYGFAPLMSSSKTHTLAAYTSPEAILNHHISPKCDVFCLGLIIFEIATGRSPQAQTDMVPWVRSAIAQGKQASLFHPTIPYRKEMEKALQIGVALSILYLSNPFVI